MDIFVTQEIKEDKQKLKKEKSDIYDLATISCEEFYNIYGGKNAY